MSYSERLDSFFRELQPLARSNRSGSRRKCRFDHDVPALVEGTPCLTQLLDSTIRDFITAPTMVGPSVESTSGGAVTALADAGQSDKRKDVDKWYVSFMNAGPIHPDFQFSERMPIMSTLYIVHVFDISEFKESDANTYLQPTVFVPEYKVSIDIEVLDKIRACIARIPSARHTNVVLMYFRGPPDDLRMLLVTGMGARHDILTDRARRDIKRTLLEQSGAVINFKNEFIRPWPGMLFFKGIKEQDTDRHIVNGVDVATTAPTIQRVTRSNADILSCRLDQELFTTPYVDMARKYIRGKPDRCLDAFRLHSINFPLGTYPRMLDCRRDFDIAYLRDRSDPMYIVLRSTGMYTEAAYNTNAGLKGRGRQKAADFVFNLFKDCGVDGAVFCLNTEWVWFNPSHSLEIAPNEGPQLLSRINGIHESNGSDGYSRVELGDELSPERMSIEAMVMMLATNPTIMTHMRLFSQERLRPDRYVIATWAHPTGSIREHWLADQFVVPVTKLPAKINGPYRFFWLEESLSDEDIVVYRTDWNTMVAQFTPGLKGVYPFTKPGVLAAEIALTPTFDEDLHLWATEESQLAIHERKSNFFARHYTFESFLSQTLDNIYMLFRLNRAPYSPINLLIDLPNGHSILLPRRSMNSLIEVDRQQRKRSIRQTLGQLSMGI